MQNLKKKRHKKEKRQGPYPEIPLYTAEDVRACLPLFSTIDYGHPFSLGGGTEATLYDAGHVLGSSIIMLKVHQGNDTRTIIFSGDLGRNGSPILRDPTTFDAADYIVMESTYGNKLHESREEAINTLAEAINKTDEAGGDIVIPAFAVERAQDLLFYLNLLLRQNLIPHLAIFLDSPMAVRITRVFHAHPELFDTEMTRLLYHNESFFNLSKLYFVDTIDASKAINHIKGSVVIMAGSGMCTGGRIKHHLVANIMRKESSIVFTGYQAEGTLGRQIVEGSKQVRILGKEYPVRANIVQIDGFSAHADRDGLIQWLSAFKRAPRKVFITHGETSVIADFAVTLKSTFPWEFTVPEYLEQITLD